jgi:hypothetical protein
MMHGVLVTADRRQDIIPGCRKARRRRRNGVSMRTSPWPDLPLSAWSETCETLHRWTRIVGKVRMALTPLVNHWWNVILYVTSRELDTSAIPYAGGSAGVISAGNL